MTPSATLWSIEPCGDILRGISPRLWRPVCGHNATPWHTSMRVCRSCVSGVPSNGTVALCMAEKTAALEHQRAVSCGATSVSIAVLTRGRAAWCLAAGMPGARPTGPGHGPLLPHRCLTSPCGNGLVSLAHGRSLVIFDETREAGVSRAIMSAVIASLSVAPSGWWRMPAGPHPVPAHRHGHEMVQMEGHHCSSARRGPPHDDRPISTPLKVPLPPLAPGME